MNRASELNVRAAAVILAGGRSSRMGQDKALLEAGGSTLLDRACKTAEALQDILCQSTLEIFVSGRYSGKNCIEDIYLRRGPLGGIHAAVKHLLNRSDLVLFIPVDMPGIVAADLAELACACNIEFDGSCFSGLPLPLCLTASTALLYSIERQLADPLNSNSIRELCGSLKMQILPAPQAGGFADNLNDPQSFDGWRSRL